MALTLVAGMSWSQSQQRDLGTIATNATPRFLLESKGQTWRSCKRCHNEGEAPQVMLIYKFVAEVAFQRGITQNWLTQNWLAKTIEQNKFCSWDPVCLEEVEARDVYRNAREAKKVCETLEGCRAVTCSSTAVDEYADAECTLRAATNRKQLKDSPDNEVTYFLEIKNWRNKKMMGVDWSGKKQMSYDDALSACKPDTVCIGFTCQKLQIGGREVERCVLFDAKLGHSTLDDLIDSEGHSTTTLRWTKRLRTYAPGEYYGK